MGAESMFTSSPERGLGLFEMGMGIGIGIVLY